MALPKKRKNDIDVYGDKPYYQGESIKNRRQELLDKITKSDSFLPDSILHDDLDLGMLEFVSNEFVVVSNDEQIPVIPKILTIQRWGEITNTWEYSDRDNNIKSPFISVVRMPDVQPGTNPVTQRTIPDRSTFYYASVPNWNGNTMGADVYKIPQPVAIDISYEVTIVCTQMRDLNRFNKIVMQKFSSRQSYTTVKGHYIPIILETIQDSSPISNLEDRRYYQQTYRFVMLGFLIDEEEFEVKPALSRMLLMTEFIKENNFTKKYFNGVIDMVSVEFIAELNQVIFSVGENIGALFNVSVNGITQIRDNDYFHIDGTSKISFETPPDEGSKIEIIYFPGKNKTSGAIIDNYGRIIQITTETFIYDGSTLSFTTNQTIIDVISVDTNGLIEEPNIGYEITGSRTFRYLTAPISGSTINITYLY